MLNRSPVLVLQASDDTLNWSPTLEPHILSPEPLSKESMSFFVGGSLNQKERHGKIVPVLWKKGNTPRESSPPGQQPLPSSRTENSVSSIREIEEGSYEQHHQEGCLQELSRFNTSATSDNSGQTRTLRPERLRKRCLKDAIAAGGSAPLSPVNVICLASAYYCFAIVFLGHAIVFSFCLYYSNLTQRESRVNHESPFSWNVEYGITFIVV